MAKPVLVDDSQFKDVAAPKAEFRGSEDRGNEPVLMDDSSFVDIDPVEENKPFSIVDDVISPVWDTAVDVMSVPSQVLGGGIDAIENDGDFVDGVSDPFTEYPLREKAKLPSDSQFVQSVFDAAMPLTGAGALYQEFPKGGKDFVIDAFTDPTNVLGTPLAKVAKYSVGKMGRVIDLAKNGSQKLLGAFFGVPYDDIKVIGQVQKTGEKILDTSEIKNIVDDAFENVRGAKDNSKNVVDGIVEDIKAHKRASRELLKEKAKDYRVEEYVFEQIDKLEESLRESSKVADDLLESYSGSTGSSKAVADAGESLVEGGEKIDDIIPGDIDTTELVAKLKSRIENLYSVPSKKKAISGSTYKAIEHLKRAVSNMKDGLGGREAKNIINELNEDIVYNQGGILQDLSPRHVNEIKGAVHDIRQLLGNVVEGYNDAMIPVARKTALIVSLKKNFKGIDRIRSSLDSIVSGRKVDARELLERLDNEMGSTILDELADSTMAKRLLSGNQIDLANIFDGSAKKQYGQSLLEAEANHAANSARLDAVRSLSRDSSETAIQKVGMQSKGIIEKVKQLKFIGDEAYHLGLIDEPLDLVWEARKSEALRSFDKTNINGGRRTTWMNRVGDKVLGGLGAAVGYGMFGYIGGVAGGGLGGGLGVFLGGLSGMLIDVQGPERAGKIMSAFAKTANFKNNVQTVLGTAGKMVGGEIALDVSKNILSLPGVARHLVEQGADEDSEFRNSGILSINDENILNEIGDYAINSDIGSSVDKLLFIKKLKAEGNINIQLLPTEPTKKTKSPGENIKKSKRGLEEIIKSFEEQQ